MKESGRGEWWQSYFDDDFIELYAPLLPREESAAQAETIVEILGLGPGARVLDLGCGWGRHAVELARLGCEVLALDQSEALLEHGRRLAQESGVSVEWVHGDMRELRYDAEFDAVVSLFSSLGYSEGDADDLRVLDGARRALRPEGSFLLETMHRDQVVQHYAERDWWRGAAGGPVWVERELDAVSGVSREWLRWLQDGEVREKYHEIRVRTATDWSTLLARSGLDPLVWYGDWDLCPFEHRSEKLIVVCQPAG
jgi:cyclopropane fatty-acyl-phospholipid synthase-like methyltransferase